MSQSTALPKWKRESISLYLLAPCILVSFKQCSCCHAVFPRSPPTLREGRRGEWGGDVIDYDSSTPHVPACCSPAVGFMRPLLWDKHWSDTSWFSLLSLCEVYTHFELVQPEIKSNYESNLSHCRHTFRCQAHLLCKKVVHPALETWHATAVAMRCSSRKFLLLTNYMLLVSRYLYVCCKCKGCFLSVGTF